jgi:hypothetical protein
VGIPYNRRSFFEGGFGFGIMHLASGGSMRDFSDLSRKMKVETLTMRDDSWRVPAIIVDRVRGTL